jgi:hypothetical protein
MNAAIDRFVEESKGKPEVLGVILFGSWARGNQRPGSDVDLVVVVSKGLSRTVEHLDGQTFEIIYTTADGAFDYWSGHRDDAAGVWGVARVLSDKDGSVERLRARTLEMLSEGKACSSICEESGRLHLSNVSPGSRR